MNRLGTELLGFITDFFRVIFTPRAFLESLASGTRSRWRGWGVGVVYLAAPLITILPLSMTESLATMAGLSLGLMSFPATATLILIAIGGKLASPPKWGRELALYSLAPLALVTGLAALLLDYFANNHYLWFLGFRGQIGNQDILAFLPYWAPASPVTYLVATACYSALDMFDGPEPGFLWGSMSSGNVLFSLGLLPLAFWQNYFLRKAAQTFGGNLRSVSWLWLIYGVIGIPLALMMALLTGAFLAP